MQSPIIYCRGGPSERFSDLDVLFLTARQETWGDTLHHNNIILIMAADGWHTFTGEVIPLGVTRVCIDESLTVIPARAFKGNRHIEEVKCHIDVKTVEGYAFHNCRSLRKVRMPGVRVVKRYTFYDCEALTDVECGKLERIRESAFGRCISLGNINLPSAKIVEECAFSRCKSLTNVIFGKELESIGWRAAFYRCTSLERITIPLKDGMITYDSIFQECKNLKHVDLVEGAVLRDTIDALLLDEWRNDMKDEIGAINQILPDTPAGSCYNFEVGGKAQAVRMWIRTVLRKIIHCKAQHCSYLNEAAAALQLDLPNDVVNKNVLPFLELPSYTFQGED
eukprot:scaffold14122_cov87-Skeletonema_dohrnii-CCMP3373.AAC.2